MRLRFVSQAAKVGVGLFTGAAGGVCAAVLFAPEEPADKTALRTPVAFNPTVSSYHRGTIEGGTPEIIITKKNLPCAQKLHHITLVRESIKVTRESL